jgi:hypothetical protein
MYVVTISSDSLRKYHGYNLAESKILMDVIWRNFPGGPGAVIQIHTSGMIISLMLNLKTCG